MTCCGSTTPDLTASSKIEHDAKSDLGKQQVVSFMVPLMHCAGCIRKLESGLLKNDIVDEVRANLSTRQVEVRWRGETDSPEIFLQQIADLGFDCHVVDSNADADAEMQQQGKHLTLCLAVAGFAAANIMLLSISVWSGAEPETAKLFGLISGLIAVPAVFFAGSPFFSSAAKALASRKLNMDVPISLAVILSLCMSLYEALIGGGETFFDAGVMLLFFLLIGRKLDHMMREKAAGGVKALARLIPRKVRRLGDDGSNVLIDLSEVKPGMVLSLLPGDRFPVDARVEQGLSAADRSLVTGEADEVPIRPGDIFEAGTLNIAGPIIIKATSDSKTSFMAEVMEMMKAAEVSKGRYRRIADRMAAVYAPAVHLLALFTFVAWVLTGGEIKPALVAAIAVLIITCPCALGLAVPVTHVVAANRLFGQGVLMRDGSALERLAEINAVYFDKTGTLTSSELRMVGRPQLKEPFASVLHALSVHSRHPSARALAVSYSGTGSEKLNEIAEIAGYGVEAIWNGKRVRLGRPSWVAELAGRDDDGQQRSAAFAIEGEVFTAFLMESDLKPNAEEAIAQILSQTQNVEILSGDCEANVKDVALRSGISSWQSELTPKQKIDWVSAHQNTDKALMVGDGLNDAPALAVAHVSMAPASAADVSRSTADFVLTRPSLAAVPFAMRIAKASRRIVLQNFAIAIVYNCIAIPLAVLGHVTPLVAAVAMSLSSIVVVSNSLRLVTFNRQTSSKPTKANAHVTTTLTTLSTSEVQS